MTSDFHDLLLLLGGFILALVTGPVYRIVQSSGLCAEAVVVPSRERRRAAHAPRADFSVAVFTALGLAILPVRGLISPDLAREVAVGAVGVLGAVILRVSARRARRPLPEPGSGADRISSVRNISAAGFGQIEVSPARTNTTLAAVRPSAS